jgi:hypothetical protein
MEVATNLFALLIASHYEIKLSIPSAAFAFANSHPKL